MKVKDLIIELLEYNMDAEVTCSTHETINVAYISSTENELYDKSDTPIVFIDGCDIERCE